MKYFNHLLISIFLFCAQASATPRTINFQANIRKPDSSRLEASDVSYRFKYLNAAGTCTVYIEDFNNISMVGSSGNISLKMGTGTKVFPPAAVTLYQTFSNNTSNIFSCSEGGNYSPLSSDERRNLSVEFFYTGSGGVQTLNGIEINSVPYALHANEAEDAQKLGGFDAALYAKFSNFTTCTGGQVLTYNGTIFSCVSPGAAATFTGVLAGDVSGTQSATVVDTVGGKTSAQISTSVDDTLNATSVVTPLRIVKRDASGNAAFNTAQANNFSGRNLLLYEPTNTNHIQVQAPATFAGGDYILTLPDSNGTAGQVLSTDGNGVTSWIPASSGSVTNVSASAPLLSSGGATPNITMPAATVAVDGYLSAADFTTFNNKQIAGNYITALTGDVTATGPGSAAATIANNAITTSKINNLAVTDAKINDVAFGKITGRPTTLAGYGITDAITNVTAGSPLVSSGGATPNITMPAASAAVDGYLSAADFTTFNNKVSSQWTNNLVDIYFNTGNVGIGTNTPTQALDVAGNIQISAGSQILANGASLLRESGASTYVGNGAIQTTNSGGAVSLFVYGNGGSVGIGTVTPAYKLDVAGDVNVTGNFKINGVNIASGTVTSVAATAPLTSTGGATPTIAMPAATGAVDGYLSAADFTIFNNKQPAGSYITALTGDVTATGPGSAAATIANNAITTSKINNLAVTDAKINDVAFSKITGRPTTLAGYGITDAITNVTAGAPLVSSGGTTPNITMPAATGAVDGYLSAANFTTFNNKVSSQWTNNAADIYFNTGRVGIGTNTPGSKLSIRDTAAAVTTGQELVRLSGLMDATIVGSGPKINFENSAANIVGASIRSYTFGVGATGLGFDTGYGAPTTKMVIDNSGNVGIGNLSPAYKLDVVGDVNVTGNFKVNGVDISSGTVTSVGATSPLTSTGGATPTIAMPAATGAVDGYLSAANFTTFNNKQPAGNYITALTGDVTAAGPGSSVATIANLAVTDAKINDVAFSKITGRPTTLAGYGITDAITNVTAGAPLVSSGGTTPNITMPAATGAVDGYLTAANFTTFNNKVSSQWTNNAADIYFNTGRVGIGTATPTASLDVNGAAVFGSTGKLNISTLGVISSSVAGNYIPISINNPTGYAHMVVNGAVDFGSNGADGYIKLHDNSKGVFLNGSGIQFNHASGTEAMRISSNGRLGLGIANPGYKVDVVGDVNISGNFKINGVDIASGTVTSVGATAPLTSTGGATPTIAMPAATGAVDGYLTAANFNTFNNKVSSQWVTSGLDIYNGNLGNVGIGVAFPSQKLQVAGSILVNSEDNFIGVDSGIDSRLGLIKKSGNYPAIAAGNGSPMLFGHMSTANLAGNISSGTFTEDLRIAGNGNVGIGGITFPAYKLDVNGDINIPTGSNFKINGVNIGTGTVTGTGTINTVPKFTAAGAIGNSNISDNGTVITLATDATVNGVKIGRGASSVASNTALGVSTLQSNTTGSYNVAVGQSALTSNANGNYNAAVGVSALSANTSGSSNAAFGANAMMFNTNGGNNTGIGSNALRANISGNDNMAVGGTALYANTTGSSNVAAGYGALRGNTTGNFNVATGTYSLFTNSVGAGNVANGHQALYYATGNYNTGMGHSALQANTTGINNSAFGYNSGNAITTGSYNVVIGSNTGSTIATSSNNIIISDGAGTIRQQIDSSGFVGIGMAPSTYRMSVSGDINLTAGSNFRVNGAIVGTGTVTGTGTINTVPKFTAAGAIGNSNISDDGSTVTISTGATVNGLVIGRGGGNLTSNTALGQNALQFNTTGTDNVAVGQLALRANTSGMINTALGKEALVGNTTGTGNVAAGYRSLASNTSGGSNVAVGTSSLEVNTIGYANAALGGNSLQSNTTGVLNVAVGSDALKFNTTGDSNTATGFSALGTNTIGYENVAYGQYSLSSNTTATLNTAIGTDALRNSSTGTQNTALGHSSLRSMTTGSTNLGLGYNAGSSITSGSNNVVIGSNIGSTIATTNNNIIISDGSGNIRIHADSSGQIGMGVVPTQALDVVGNIKTSGCLYYSGGSIGVCASDQQLKTDVHAFDLGLETLLGIHPVNFKYNGKAGLKFNGQEQIGVIAQDLEKAAPSLVKRQMVQMNPEDKEKTEIKVVDYGAFTYVVINSIKDLYNKWFADSKVLHREIASVKQENVQLKNENEKIKQENEKIKARLDRIEKMLDSK